MTDEWCSADDSTENEDSDSEDNITETRRNTGRGAGVRGIVIGRARGTTSGRVTGRGRGRGRGIQRGRGPRANEVLYTWTLAPEGMYTMSWELCVSWGGDQSSHTCHCVCVRVCTYVYVCVCVCDEYCFPLDDTAPTADTFTPQAGPKVSPSVKTPEDCFSLFFDDILIDFIVDNTNRYALHLSMF